MILCTIYHNGYKSPYHFDYLLYYSEFIFYSVFVYYLVDSDGVSNLSELAVLESAILASSKSNNGYVSHHYISSHTVLNGANEHICLCHLRRFVNLALTLPSNNNLNISTNSVAKLISAIVTLSPTRNVRIFKC
jgi:hypothetical protein